MSHIPANAWKLFATLSEFQKDYAVIGGTATVFHLEERNANSQRATVDLDMAILELATLPGTRGIWDALREFFTSHGYLSQSLQSGKSQAFRFEAPQERQDLPALVEIFSEEVVPDSERWVHRIPEAEMSAIVLPRSAIELVSKHKVIHEREGVAISLASASSLVMLKALACQNLLSNPNPTEKAKHRKHIGDMLRLAYVLRAGDEIEIPTDLWSHVAPFVGAPKEYFPPQRIKDSLWADYPDLTTRRAIKNFSPEMFAEIIARYLRREP